jgi:hypothetical protein
MEQLVLVVAADDERIELCPAHLLAHAVHGALRIVKALGDGFGRHEGRGVLGRFGEDLAVGDAVAELVVEGQPVVAVAELRDPILELAGQHDTVRGSEGGGQASHEASLLMPFGKDHCRVRLQRRNRL